MSDTETGQEFDLMDPIVRQVSALVATTAEAWSGGDDARETMMLEALLYEELAGNCAYKAKLTREALDADDKA
jgi:hypothetical protein